MVTTQSSRYAILQYPLLALATSIVMHFALTIPSVYLSANPPASAEAWYFNEKLVQSESGPRNTSTVTPSPELERGEPGSLQRELYPGREATLLVMNDLNADSRLNIFWQNIVRSVAPPKGRARLEAFLGQTLHIEASKESSMNVTLQSPFTAIMFQDGKLQFANFSSESDVEPLMHSGFNATTTPPQSQAKAIKVRNLSNRRFHEYWLPGDGRQPVYQGVIEANSETTTNSYLTHTFRFTELRDRTSVVFEFTVNDGQDIYAFVDDATADPQRLKRHIEELDFASRYKEKHHGRPWLSYYPHHPLQAFMWPADYIGQEHEVFTDHGPDGVPMNFTLKCVSVRPRVFEVDFLLSQAEAESIIELAKDRLHRSSVQAHGENGERVDSDTRTSQNAWLARHTNSMIDRIYRRVADLANIPHEHLTHSPPHGLAENMQVVHYTGSAYYASHHDWGVQDSPFTRFATALLYLNNPEMGGQTTFPKARGYGPDGLVVHPRRGKVVLFYSQFPDGNVDDESLHEARPVSRGEKWLANIWLREMGKSNIS